jgi:hypothetical protein
MCRANGTAVVMEFNGANQKVTLAYNTITGDGDTLFIGGGSDAGYTPNSGNVTSMYNNVLLGQVSVIPRDGGALTALAWFSDCAYNGVTNYGSNVIWNVRSNFCPSGNICKDPQLTNETLTGFNASPLTSSPALGNANRSLYSVAWDYYGNPRSASGPIDIGAVAYRGQAYIGSGSGDSPLPPSGGTHPASDVPVPAQPKASVNPVPAGSGLESGPGAVRERLRDSSNRERYYAPGSIVRAQRNPGLWQPQPAAIETASSNRASTANVATPIPAAAQPATAAAPASTPVTRSYLLAVFDWLADVYHKSRYVFQY